MLAVLHSFAWAQDLDFNYTPAPGPGENPALLITPARTVNTLFVSCEVGGKKVEQTKKGVAEGSTARFEWPRNPAVTHAECFVRASFSGGDVTETTVPVDYQYTSPLSVNLSKARADIDKRTVTVVAGGPVTEAEIVAYGAHKAEMDRRVVPVEGGPGEVTVPFVGDPAEVVLLDVTLRNASAWAGFTYSPWFLDIPHDDVLFASDADTIAADEEWKLNSTLEQLKDVLDKYGSVVPVKLYIAGCTDTVGDGAHNKDLSQRRALSIARWLRGHGYTQPIYYWGFGEGLLAVQTGDGVDNAVNRRALYMVGANPPPAGSGVPSVGWVLLK
jgi:outer membrane protein OmpA-like peptidoglycan-associated protein